MIHILSEAIQGLVNAVLKCTECTEDRFDPCLILTPGDDTGCGRCQALSHLRHAAYLSKTAKR